MRIEFCEEPFDNGQGGIRIGETETHCVDIVMMIYNNRVVLTPKSCELVWDAGWCYPDYVTALAATVLWSTNDDPEPRYWLKDPVSGRRWQDMDWEDPAIRPLTDKIEEQVA